MRRHTASGQAKAYSLVYSFPESLHQDGQIGAAEPDFQKWMDNVLFADVGTASDECDNDSLSDAERKAWRLFHDAIQATSNLLELYKTDPGLFHDVASQLSFLPCLMSWHPDAERFNRRLFEASCLGWQSLYGELRENAGHLVRQTWPVRYAYAIISLIGLTLDSYSDQLPIWAESYGHGVKHPFTREEIEAALARMNWSAEKKRRIRRENQGAYRILPAWTKGLEKIPRPFDKDHVLDYWRKGKEIILEEMPDFHMRPEWRVYHRRTYKLGVKTGAIQHAIFKDILLALKTIAGANKKQRSNS
ncbi:MAG: hypothetical protein NT105_04040 [Verrucomicrobia bacterium]|nr:hypothetical protein [Verrucomicrobiota bacterium]